MKRLSKVTAVIVLMSQVLAVSARAESLSCSKVFGDSRLTDFQSSSLYRKNVQSILIFSDNQKLAQRGYPLKPDNSEFKIRESLVPAMGFGSLFIRLSRDLSPVNERMSLVLSFLVRLTQEDSKTPIKDTLSYDREKAVEIFGLLDPQLTSSEILAHALLNPPKMMSGYEVRAAQYMDLAEKTLRTVGFLPANDPVHPKVWEETGASYKTLLSKLGIDAKEITKEDLQLGEQITLVVPPQSALIFVATKVSQNETTGMVASGWSPHGRQMSVFDLENLPAGTKIYSILSPK